jgi:hypothetical protein
VTEGEGRAILSRLRAAGRLTDADCRRLMVQWSSAAGARADERPARGVLSHREWASLRFLHDLAAALTRAEPGLRVPAEDTDDAELLASYERAVIQRHRDAVARLPARVATGRDRDR